MHMVSDEPSSPSHASRLSLLLSAGMAIGSMASFVNATDEQKLQGDYGYSFALVIIGWLFGLAATFFGLFGAWKQPVSI